MLAYKGGPERDATILYGYSEFITKRDNERECGGEERNKRSLKRTRHENCSMILWMENR